jgi:hypothetical protein
MAEGWRRHLERSGERWCMLAQTGVGEPWVAEGGFVTRHDDVAVNLVVGYGSEPGPWVKVGTWDHGISGPVPGTNARAETDRDNITDRLVLAALASEIPEGAACRDPAEEERRLDALRAAVAPWDPNRAAHRRSSAPGAAEQSQGASARLLDGGWPLRVRAVLRRACPERDRVLRRPRHAPADGRQRSLGTLRSAGACTCRRRRAARWRRSRQF